MPSITTHAAGTYYVHPENGDPYNVSTWGEYTFDDVDHVVNLGTGDAYFPEPIPPPPPSLPTAGAAVFIDPRPPTTIATRNEVYPSYTQPMTERQARERIDLVISDTMQNLDYDTISRICADLEELFRNRGNYRLAEAPRKTPKNSPYYRGGNV